MKIRTEQWLQLEPFLIGRRGDPGAAAKDNRLFIEAVLWVMLHQNHWRDLPREFGKWNTTYMRFRRWNQCGFWHHLEKCQIDDRDLWFMLRQITCHGDRYIERSEQRRIRKTQKDIGRSTARVNEYAKELKIPSLPVDDSISHWVGLVAG